MDKVDNDFVVIKDKLYEENKDLIKKLQKNYEYQNFVNWYSESYTKYTLAYVVYVMLMCALIFLSIKIFPNFFIYELLIGIFVTLLPLLMLIIKLSTKVKSPKNLGKRGLYYYYYNLENAYDNLLFYMNSVDLDTLSKPEKVIFYSNVSKMFNTLSFNIAKQYINKLNNISKMSEKTKKQWQEILSYYYNFGKFCTNKTKDFKTFAELNKA